MAFEICTFGLDGSVLDKRAVTALLSCNQLTQGYGLALTPAAAASLVQTRGEALYASGRLEFDGGAIEKLITSFCDSPFLNSGNYEDTLHVLLEAFYTFKNETLDMLSDDDLIHTMKGYFDGVCQGSVELLTERELPRLARVLRGGEEEDCGQDTKDGDDEAGELD